MKPYDQLDITDLVLEGDSDAISRLEAEIQDRDKAIVELWDVLLNYYSNDEGHPTIVLNKYDDFVIKTRAIYGL